MSARTLFVKIFLWFWLANTVVIATLALVVWLYPITAMGHPGMLDRLHELQVRGALAVRESRGQAAFEAHARELESATGLRTYWIDEDGKELRGQTVPAELVEIARKREPRRSDASRGGEGRLPGPMVIPLSDSAGHRYVAVVQPFGPGPGPHFEQLVSSNVFILRLLAVILTAGLGCYALARYLTSPIRRLQSAARGLAAGDLTVRVGSRLAARRDEIGELGRDFDRMAGRVEALITTQQRLLRDVSHELRSPLARLSVALEIAHRDAGPAAEPALGRVGLEAERLNELIGRLLTLARLEGGATQSPRAKINLQELLADVVADVDFEASATQRRVRISQSDPCEVLGVADLLRSAIENVVRNAAHHTPQETIVEVALRVATADGKSNARISIRDHGPGVPEELLQHVFEPFYRVSAARERQTGGTGLGLAIARSAVNVHGGSIVATNVPDGGLIVEITLPCVPAMA